MAVLRESGPEAVSTLSVLAYTSTGPDISEYRIATVLEGLDFVAEISGQPIR